MHSILKLKHHHRLLFSSSSRLLKPYILSTIPFSSTRTTTGDDEWNDAWESAWLPGDDADNNKNNRAPWEEESSNDVSPISNVGDEELDADTKAFVAEMDDRWEERRKLTSGTHRSAREREEKKKKASVASAAADEYRVRKQRIHAGLWVKEIEKSEEAKIGGGGNGAHDIDRLLDSCSEMFDSGNVDMSDSKIPSTAEIKTKPDGWETTSKTPDGNIWDISQREQDILLQEFERRIAFSKQQIASFIKTHIFSRRRPIDGWKYMIEEIGPNARKGKGSVHRLPSLTDPATQPYREEKSALAPPKPSRFRGNRP